MTQHPYRFDAIPIKISAVFFDTEIESTSPKSEQDSGILDVEDEEDDEEVTNI